MAKGLPGSSTGQGSFFEVLEERTVRLRPEEMNGRYAPAKPATMKRLRWRGERPRSLALVQ